MIRSFKTLEYKVHVLSIKDWGPIEKTQGHLL